MSRNTSHLGRGIYVASKRVHAPLWRLMREGGFPIVARWLDAPEGTSKRDVWTNAAEDIRSVACLVAYGLPSEVQKGLIAEVGMAIMLGRPVLYVGLDPDTYTMLSHPMCVPMASLAEAFDKAKLYTGGRCS